MTHDSINYTFSYKITLAKERAVIVTPTFCHGTVRCMFSLNVLL